MRISCYTHYSTTIPCLFAVVVVGEGIGPSNGTGFEEIDPEDCVSMVQLALQKCLEKEVLCNEFYLQLVKQTTDQPEPNGRINIQNWRFMCLVCGVVVPRNRVILNYLQTHLRRCGIEAHTEEGKYAQFALQVRTHSNNQCQTRCGFTNTVSCFLTNVSH